MLTQPGYSLCAAIIISYLKFKKKAFVKELLYAYDNIKDIEKIDGKLPVIIKKISNKYETSVKGEDVLFWASGYMHYSPPIADGNEGLLFLETISNLEKVGLIITELSDSIHNILEKEGYWEFPSVILDSEISITDKWDIAQKIFDINLKDILEDSHRINPIKIEPIWFSNNKINTDIFVIMPFDDYLKPVFDDHIKKVCRLLKLSVIRADDLFAPTTIMDDIWGLLVNSKIIICDCTGKNPNVFYELGIAHTISKEVIIITQNKKDIPFDINHIRYIKYDYTPPGMSKFEKDLKKSIAEVLKQ